MVPAGKFVVILLNLAMILPIIRFIQIILLSQKGHGVGAGLNVHEGPHSISPRWANKEPMKN